MKFHNRCLPKKSEMIEFDSFIKEEDLINLSLASRKLTWFKADCKVMMLRMKSSKENKQLGSLGS